MPKYKVKSASLNCTFESDEELDFDQAVVRALEFDDPKTVGWIVSVKKYGRRPGSIPRYGLMRPILEKLGIWTDETAKLPPPPPPGPRPPDGYLLKPTGTISTGDLIHSEYDGGKWITAPDKFVGRKTSIFHKVAGRAEQ